MKRSSFQVASALLWVAATAFGQTAPAGPTFEVATIKPSPPFSMENFMSHKGVKIDKAYADIGGASLTNLIAFAYRVKDYQVSAPDWMNGAHFDVLAKLPDGASKDSVPEMLQALLAERFHLRLHTVSKEMSVYALVLRQGAKLPPKPTDYQPDYKPRYGPVDMKELSPTTMERYARGLSGAVDRPIVDQTGLDGEYMLPVFAALSASNAYYAGVVAKQREAAVGHDALVDALAANAANAPGVSTALPRELKLESRKLPMTVLMIDHMDENPTAN